MEGVVGAGAGSGESGMAASSSDKMNLRSGTCNNVCRICMSTKTRLLPIFSVNPQEALSDKITYCTGIEIKEGDGLPTHLCAPCFNDLKIAYRFKTSCILSDETFKLNSKKTIKTERLDKDEIFGSDYDQDDFLDDDFFGDSPKKEDVKPRIKKIKVEKRESDGKKKSVVPRVARPRKYPLKDDAEIKRRKKRKSKLHCDQCDIKFPNKAKYTEHNSTIHENRVFMCELCGKVFRHQSSQSAHKLTHQEPRFHCNDCDYRTFYKQDLVTHMRVHSGVKNHTCKYCGRQFAKSSNCYAHTRRVHERAMWSTFVCHVCGQSFFAKVELVSHLEMHANKKNYKCHICHALLRQRKSWKKHLLRQHNYQVPRLRSGRPRNFGPETNSINLANSLNLEATTAANLAANIESLPSNLESMSNINTNMPTNLNSMVNLHSNMATNLSSNMATNLSNMAILSQNMPTNLTSMATNLTNMPTNLTSMATNLTNMPTNLTSMATNLTSMATNLTSMATITPNNPNETTRPVMDEFMITTQNVTYV